MRVVMVLILGFLALSAGRTPAQATEVDLQLILAVDVSRSIDEEEAKLQRTGYIEAMMHPMVIDAIMSGPKKRIAVTYVEWAGVSFQKVIIGWTLIDSPEAAKAFAARLAEAPRTAEM